MKRIRKTSIEVRSKYSVKTRLAPKIVAVEASEGGQAEFAESKRDAELPEVVLEENKLDSERMRRA